MSLSIGLRRDGWVYLSIAALALLAWGGILVTPNALFWDDWVLANDDTLRMTRELGIPWLGPIDIGLFALGPWSFKVVVIASTILTGCLTYAIAARGLGLSQFERWLLAALVVVLPVVATRVLVSLSHYSWSLALFMIAWYLMVKRSPHDPGRVRYVGAALLLFVSYTAASLLPFTILPVAHLALLALNRDGSIVRACLAFAGRFWFILAAPVAFWIVRTLFLQPSGLYDKYNSVGDLAAVPAYIALVLGALLVGFLFVGAALVNYAVGPVPRRRWLRTLLAMIALVGSTGLLGLFLYYARVSPSPVIGRTVPVVILVCTLLLAVFALVEARRARRADDSPRPSIVPVLAIGLLTLILAMLPYLLVGKLPTFAEWETRHQLLMPFGIAIIAVAAVRSITLAVRPKWARLYAGVLVVAMLGTSVAVSFALVVDWRKQMQISAALGASGIVRNASTVVFIDSAREFNYDKRSYSFYEYNGWMITAFGDQRRLGVGLSNLEGVLDGSLEGLDYAASRYGFGEFSPSDRNAVVEIVSLEDATWWGLFVNSPSVTVDVISVEDLRTVVP